MYNLGSYDFALIEKKWQNKWYMDGIYNWSGSSRDETFSIDTPPPTISGDLHIGHVYSYTQADLLARYNRMKGKDVFYPIGLDDNGLPTERLVEKELGRRACDMQRSEFISNCQNVVTKYDEAFCNLFKALALSMDWNQKYNTISADVRKLSQMSFLDLYNKQLLYYKQSPTFWDVVDQTAIAQAEIEDKEKIGIMYDISFTGEGDTEITVATTRPELLAACVAIFYHPDDIRYNTIPDFASTPIFEEKVPIIADEEVDVNKGTGLVMCCTFGAIQDVKWWKKHNLATKSVISLTGIMQNSGAYDNMKINEARRAIVSDLRTIGAIKGEIQVKQFVKCAERSGAPLELIVTPQWFIQIADKKTELLEKARECVWHPEYMLVRLENWINGLNQDWCISRQRYFGVPIPVWYSKRPGEEGKILLPEQDQLPIDPIMDLPRGYSKDEVIPDMDVMDTWATSSITPQLNTHVITDDMTLHEGAKDLSRHNKLFPFDIRPQAHEIIRTWAFYTICKSLYHEGSIPWKNIVISGWCLAADKTKMSKSKGNIVRPIEILDKFGSDVVRYWAASAKFGLDIVYSEETLKNGQKLLTKLWNVSKFVTLHIGKLDPAISHKSLVQNIQSNTIFHTIDLWLILKLQKLVGDSMKAWDEFDYFDAKMILEDFFWNILCDNYLEIAKKRVYNSDGLDTKGAISAACTMHYCLEVILKLWAPIIPHMTEEIHSVLYEQERSIHAKGSWPELGSLELAIANSHDVASKGDLVVLVLSEVRKYKSLRNISIKVPIEALYYKADRELDVQATADLSNASNANAVYATKELPKEHGLYCSEAGSCSIAIKIVD